jgi:hypothetical protein
MPGKQNARARCVVPIVDRSAVGAIVSMACVRSERAHT